MAELTDPFLEVKWGYVEGEDGWGDGLNEDLIKLAFFQNKRINGSVSSLPGSPVNGDAYFLTTDQRVYYRANFVWYSSPVPVGAEFIIKSTEEKVYYDGTATLQEYSSDFPGGLELANVTKALAVTEGLAIRGALDNDPATALQAQDSRAVLQNLSGAIAAILGFTQSSSVLRLENRQRSGNIRASGLNAAGDTVEFFTLNPVTGAVELDFDSTPVLRTVDTASGGVEVFNNSSWERVLTETADGATYAKLDGTNLFTQLNADNIRIDGNTISSTDTDGDVVVDPDGTGQFLYRTNEVADREIGSFSAAYTGFSSDPTHTVLWTRVGPQVTLMVDASSTGTSNATSFTITNLPAGIIPTEDQEVFCSGLIDDIGANLAGICTIDNSGVMTFNLLEVSGSNISTQGAFTNTGNKGIGDNFQITYTLDS